MCTLCRISICVTNCQKDLKFVLWGKKSCNVALLRNIVFFFFPSSALEEAFGNETAAAAENQPRYYKSTKN